MVFIQYLLQKQPTACKKTEREQAEKSMALPVRNDI